MTISNVFVNGLNESRTDGIISLWSEAFDDERDFIETFLRGVPSETTAVLCEKDGQVTGMMFLIPAEVNGFDCKLVYALATAKDFRKQGIATKLLESASETTPTFLAPEKASLISFYEKRGYKVTSKGIEDSVNFVEEAVENLIRFNHLKCKLKPFGMIKGLEL